MFIIKLVNESEYKGQHIYCTDQEVHNGINYCMNSDHVTNCSVGASETALTTSNRSDSKLLGDYICNNHHLYNSNELRRLYHRVISFDSDEILLPTEISHIAQQICNWYSLNGHFAVFGVHNDTDNDHIHIQVDAVNYATGNKLDIHFERAKLFKLVWYWYTQIYSHMQSDVTLLDIHIKYYWNYRTITEGIRNEYLSYIASQLQAANTAVEKYLGYPPVFPAELGYGI